jgi:hypothetical protein
MRPILKGSTDQSTIVRIVDSSDGTPETGVTAGSPGPEFWYRREGGLRVPFTAASLGAVNSSHSDGGLIHIADGYYRLDLPDAAWATGADGVMIGGANTSMVVIGTYHQLVEFDMSGSEAARLKRALDGTVLGTVGNGSSATSVIASSVDPAGSSADQFLGKVLTFARNTTTAALRGCSTRITDFAPGSPDVTLTVDTLPTAPVSGDIFSIS